MRQLQRAVFGLVLAAAFALSPNVAEAQPGVLTAGGMDLHLFRPAIDSKGHLTVNGSDILGHRDFSFGLVLDYGRNIFPFRGFVNANERPPEDAAFPDGDLRRRHLVENYVTGTLHFNFGLANYVVVGVQLPIYFLQGPNVTIPGVFNDSDRPQAVDAQGLGDITIHAKARILRAERSPIGLAAILRAQLPSGDASRFAGEPGFTLWPSVVAEWRPVRRFRTSLEVGARLSFGTHAVVPLNGITDPMGMGNATNPVLRPNTATDISYGHLLTFGLGMSGRIADSVDLVLEGYGAQIMSEFGTTGAFGFEALLGFKFFVQANSYLMIGGGAGFPRTSLQAADWRATAAFIFEPSIGDRDGDGYKDDVDQCPDEPEDFDGFQDEDGCPDPDNDRDGIPDDLDECPLVPEDRDGIQDEDGCPEGEEGDRDGDGILDDVDQCPDDPEDFDGFQDQDGCPDPDNDGDRILDVDDACPNDPETYNGFEDQDGCPDRGSVVIEDNSIIILEKIYFETDSAVIMQRSYPIIEAVSATLNGNPQITLVEIQGHADERGDDNYNIRLTRDRAASVVEALVQRGVARDRLRSAGYGERCPIDPRSNAEAWEKNRRVEFKIIRTEDGPTGVEVACPAGRDLIPQ